MISSRDVKFDEKCLSENSVSLTVEPTKDVPQVHSKAKTNVSPNKSNTTATSDQQQASIDLPEDAEDIVNEINMPDQFNDNSNRVAQWKSSSTEEIVQKRAETSKKKSTTQQHIDTSNILPERTRKKIQANIASTHSHFTPNTYDEAVNCANASS